MSNASPTWKRRRTNNRTCVTGSCHDGFSVRHRAARKKPKHPHHFAGAAAAGALAKAIEQYAPPFIPGPLRTEAYAWEALGTHQPTGAEGVIGGLLTARPERAQLLGDPAPPGPGGAGPGRTASASPPGGSPSFVADLRNDWPPRPTSGPSRRCPGAPRCAAPGPPARRG
ncbi:Scr1 family TA system antitoxin-like transcriptional regulator [Streptomyces sp. NPDC088190]|uniref:Scr1 family TA system antitoxin-like transcriptional regulator n=1 Tax=unclassified Streptomyces TaxID=2593676 RepID=UPI0037FAE2DF